MYEKSPWRQTFLPQKSGSNFLSRNKSERMGSKRGELFLSIVPRWEPRLLGEQPIALGGAGYHKGRSKTRLRKRER